MPSYSPVTHQFFSTFVHRDIVGPKGDITTAHTLDEAMERLRKNHYRLCKALMEAREEPAIVAEWRRAPEGSVGWRNMIFYGEALRVLRASTRD